MSVETKSFEKNRGFLLRAGDIQEIGDNTVLLACSLKYDSAIKRSSLYDYCYPFRNTARTINSLSNINARKLLQICNKENTLYICDNENIYLGIFLRTCLVDY